MLCTMPRMHAQGGTSIALGMQCAMTVPLLFTLSINPFRYPFWVPQARRSLTTQGRVAVREIASAAVTKDIHHG